MPRTRIRTAARLAGLLTAGALVAAGLQLVGDDVGGGSAAAAPPTAEDHLRSGFAVLRRPRSAADTLGGRTDGIPKSLYHVDEVRRIASTRPGPGGRLRRTEGFVAPGPDATLCMLNIPPGFGGPGGFCIPAAEALAGELVYAVNAGGGRSEVTGVLPDGVREVVVKTRRGARVRVPVADNGFGVQLRGAPAEVRFRLGGRERRLPF